MASLTINRFDKSKKKGKRLKRLASLSINPKGLLGKLLIRRKKQEAARKGM